MATEEAAYTVVDAFMDIEIREYASFAVAETGMPADMDRGKAASSAFFMLLKYIQGNNTAGTSIEMTAPVLQGKGTEIAMTAPVIQQQEGTGWKVSFVLPAQYSRDTAPVPADTRIQLVQIPARQVAAITYSGRWTDKNFDKFRNKLAGVLKERGITTSGNYVSAAYNAPFVPPFMRRNEVLVDIRPGSSPE